MAKKKKNQAPVQLSDSAYLKSGRARKLPVYECWISPGWQEIGLAHIIVSRSHVNGNVTFGTFIVDILCLGVKDAWYMVNVSKFEYSGYLEKFDFESIGYIEVHNIIFGALAFAEDFGFEPHPDFHLAKMVLQEDTDEVPLIEYDFGIEGKPRLVVPPGDQRLSQYISKLKKYAGEGNYDVVLTDIDDEYEDDDDYDEDNDFDYPYDEFDDEPLDWDEYIIQSTPESLLIERRNFIHIFEKVIYEPEMAGKQLAAAGHTQTLGVSITFEPLKHNLSHEEMTEGTQLNNDLHTPGVSKQALEQILKRIEKAIAKWPNTPMFYNYLINCYTRLEDDQKRKEAIKSTAKKFPDYFFGKVSYAQLLIEEDRLDEVPELFNNSFDIKNAFPEKEIFHISEFIAFTKIICLYFVHKEDIFSAYLYRSLMDKIDIPKELNIDTYIGFELDYKIYEMVRDLIEDAQKDEKRRKELVDILS